ncbi:MULTISPECIES: thermonuclease family protein [unclassified Aureimonas]|uniref:thermonuclease family protein n=1 Tax=unclassified Aureimonas TaxID=2615206 RepID=UPI0006F85CDF|nr:MULTISPECIES: thermonuclease family protein [unclassified Aureimonas]KQT55119.1 hypothetical protein ASG62_09690 [Aureimonas sp. Leaf427]KQT70909.1 hypothetical protein ASG54_20075 [Aureimonas sp. Leaf460]
MMLDDSPTEAPSPARRITLMIAGLVLIAGSFAFTVPRRAEIAASMAPPMVLEVPDEMPDMEPEVADTGSDGGADAPQAAATAGGASTATTGIPAPVAIERAPAGQSLPPLAVDRTAEPAKPKMQVLTRPIAIDTATFLIGRARVKLVGVEPAPVGKRCEAKYGGTWPCGATARTALRSWLRARSIACDVPEDFAKSSSMTESRCFLGERDIGTWLVESGWATAVPGGPYETAEAKAKEAGLGIWGGG